MLFDLLALDLYSVLRARSLRAALVREELEEVSVQAHGVLADERAFFVLQALLEEDGEARKSVESLGAEVRHLAACHHGVGEIQGSWRCLVLGLRAKLCSQCVGTTLTHVQRLSCLGALASCRAMQANASTCTQLD